MKTITDHILAKTTKIKKFKEVTPGEHHYSMFNDGGVEVEIAELLHSLIRVWKPTNILETGTHLGISSLYMALACEENQIGNVTTCEILPELQAKAIQLWQDLKVTHRITSLLKPSLEYESQDIIDFLFLDSEPQLRFNEFIKFFPLVKSGGLIVIHDLHPSLGHHGQTYHDVYDWPYGDWKPKLGGYIETHQVQLIHPPNPRGCTIFQKVDPSWEAFKYLKGSNV